MITFAVLWVFTIVLLSIVAPLSGELAYSGFYAPDIIHTSEDYAGAWLIGMQMNVTLHGMLRYATLHPLVTQVSFFLRFHFTHTNFS